MSAKGSEKGWERVQIMAFTSWINGLLEKRDLKIKDIANDMDDGVKMINFLEILADKKMKEKYAKNPNSRIQKIENLALAFNFLNKEIQIPVSASAEDFADHKLKMILGTFWTLFRHYRIQTIKHEDKSSEEGLISWVKKITEGYRDVHIDSYKNSFRSGMAFLAMCDQFLDHDKSVLDYDTFSKEKGVENLKTAFQVAEQHLRVPPLLNAEEVHEGDVDERSLVLYISLFFHAFMAKQAQKAMLEERAKIEGEMRGLQGSLEDRAKMAAVLDEENRKLKEEIASLKAQLEEAHKQSQKLQTHQEELSINFQAQLEAKDAALAHKDKEIEAAKLAAEQEKLKIAEAHKLALAEKDKELEAFKLKFEESQGHLNNEKEENKKLEERRQFLESQNVSLENDIADWSKKYIKTVQDHENKDSVQLNGLGTLKKNLEQHVEDLRRWQKYLDFDKKSEVDFSGDIRPTILTEILGKDYESQLKYLSDKLAKENDDLEGYLKIKEEDKKAQAAKDAAKKDKNKN